MDQELKLQFVNTFSTLITAAFGLVAALAWNEAIKSAINEFISSDNNTAALLIYAVIVTLIAVIVMFIISRSVKKLSDKIKETDAKKAE